mgnify:CR=1 FL=1
MIEANNIEEIINLELHRAYVALNKGLVRTAQKHIYRAKELNLSVAKF